ncbi:MAG: aminotransferase class I/II-fold pyridoxal phosphate-dependent enzyme [Oscillospiraceae bacterium]|jgi:histidinol-phosphate aminotransferase|nr:aminotransferase class I/II-fold pyridoxal phosphate-dependent enzyme [Oscillospiraceae bacterium]
MSDTRADTTKYYSPLARMLSPYVAGEQPQSGGWIKLNTNESPYPPSPRVIEAVRGAVGEDAAALRLYPDPDADALRDALSKRHGVNRENVFISNGSDETLAFMFAAFFAGLDCVTPAVGYSFYPTYALLFGAKLRLIPMADGFNAGLNVDVGGLLNANAPIIIANPNAPTTIALSRETILDMRETLAKRSQLLVVDEAYAPFHEDCAVADGCARYDNLLVVRTFSKAYALAGMRVGYAIGHSDLIDALCRVRDSFNSYPVDRVAQAAALAAAEDVETLSRTVAAISDTKITSRQALLSLGFECAHSHTNFLFARHPRVKGRILYDGLAARRILVRRFDKPGIEDYLRITIGTPDEMKRVIQALTDILKETLS